MKQSAPDLAKHLLARWEDLKSARAPWDTLWQELAEHVLPRKENVCRQDSPSSGANAQLFDTTAMEANKVLANGMMGSMTPADGRWFSYDPPQHLKDNDEAKQWFARCTEITQDNLAKSNFYSEIHELYFDDGGFGTANIYCQEGRNAALNFQTLSNRSYCLDEDDEGNVDTCFREIKLTCRQAAMKFGEEALSDRMRKEIADYNSKGKGGREKHSFLHAMYPRMESEREAGKRDGVNKPFASVYIDVKARHVVRNDGYDERPFFASRHLKWGESVYGIAPSLAALPESRQLNFLSKHLDVLAEVKAFPRFLVPDTHEDEIDLRAGGKTYFDPNTPGGVPREWLTSGDYNIGLEREKRKQERIEQAFHVDLFRMFAQRDKQMTAREVAELSAEKLNQFTPAFARKTTELFTPMLRRVFGIQLRAGLFPAPPEGVIERDQQTGELYLSDPEISYTSRVALAIKAMANIAFQRTMEGLMPLAPLRPDVFDNFDFDRIARDGARNDGLPADWMLPADKVGEIRAGRAEAQAQAAQQQEMLNAADAASKAGNISKDSALAEMLTQ